MLIFFLCLALLLPICVYALTFNYGGIDSDVVNAQALLEQGILLSDSISRDVEENNTYVYYSFNESDFRSYWTGGYTYFEGPNWILGWYLPNYLTCHNVGPTRYNIANADIIGNYSATYNMSVFHVYDGYLNPDRPVEVATAIFTVPSGWDNISHCVNNGNVTLTLGVGFSQQNRDLFGFGLWFWNFVTGRYTYGMPVIFVWIVDALILCGVLSAILLVKEFIPLLP
ncbi:MAG: hypothetical protein Q6356_003265 [Candidatus Wukongarchaeota archaeon]|nr:hypothetical protein [Candidatus Wukongarchaeota archaeon]